jgi:hypothetical protein
MKKTRKPSKPVSPEAIARLAEQGKDVTRFSRVKAAWFSRFSG